MQSSTETKRFKRGDVREDGRVFWRHDLRSPGGEYWMAREKFEASLQDVRARAASYYTKNRASINARDAARRAKFKEARLEKLNHPGIKRLKRGDVRDDGRVFWRYAYSCSGGERWVTKEQFESRRSASVSRSAEYRLENRELIQKRRADYYARPEVKARLSAYNHTRRKQDPLFVMKCRLRRRTHHAFARIGKSKPTKSEELLGCSWEKAKAYIEKQFAPGMSWENRSEWHIDHVIPLASAYDEYTTRMLCHFTNLKPLWKRENSSKNDAWYPPEYHI